MGLFSRSKTFCKVVAQPARRAAMSGGFPLVDAVQADIMGLDFTDDPAEAGIVPGCVGDFLVSNLVDAFHTAAFGVSNVVYATQPPLS
jgi:hypothetical protein